MGKHIGQAEWADYQGNGINSTATLRRFLHSSRYSGSRDDSQELLRYLSRAFSAVKPSSPTFCIRTVVTGTSPEASIAAARHTELNVRGAFPQWIPSSLA
jgi:hypothetical protein